VKQHWNKAPAIWFPRLGWAHRTQTMAWRVPVLCVPNQHSYGSRLAPPSEWIKSAMDPREGDWS